MNTYSIRCMAILFLSVFVVFSSLSLAQAADKDGPMPKPSRNTSAQPGVKAKKPVLTPDLKNKTLQDAKILLKKHGLKLGSVRYTAKWKGKNGTIARQSPSAKTAVPSGSRVHIWVLRTKPAMAGKQDAKPQPIPRPKLTAKEKALYMEFPKPMKNVVVYDEKGNVLQYFKSGRSFDITKSLKKTNGGRIFLGLKEGGPSDVVPMRWDPGSRAERLAVSLARFRYHLRRWAIIEDDEIIDRNEPDNNSITGAPRLSVGHFTARVGGDDASDYIKIQSTHRGFGTLIQVTKLEGNIDLALYDPARRYWTTDSRKVWIALTPETDFYVQILPRGGETGYRISISKNYLVDAYEPNDSFGEADDFGAGRAFLGNVVNGAGRHVGISDYYTINVPGPRHLRIEVAGAGLDPSDEVELSLYNSNRTHVISHTGNSAGCVLDYDMRPHWEDVDWPPFPAGEWRIEVRTPEATAGYPEAYGTGDPPACYTQEPGYRLTTTVLD